MRQTARKSTSKPIEKAKRSSTKRCNHLKRDVRKRQEQTDSNKLITFCRPKITNDSDSTEEDDDDDDNDANNNNDISNDEEEDEDNDDDDDGEESNDSSKPTIAVGKVKNIFFLKYFEIIGKRIFIL